jgi:hypothetical protein
MRGAQLIAVLPKTRFEFSYLGPGATQSTVIWRALPVLPFYWLWLGIRVHAIDLSGGNGTYVLDASNTLPSDEDPAEFTIASPALSITLNSSTAAPSVQIVTASNAGPMLRMMLKMTQSTPSARAMYAEISGELYGRAS